jgi:hypothetical protein
MAGLLDLLNGDTGGLLDFLRANGAAAIANNPGTMPSDTANYGAPAPMSLAPAPQARDVQNNNVPLPLDNMKWPYGPIDAPAPFTRSANANAAMPAAAAPMSIAGPVPAAPEGDNRFMLGLKGLIGNLHNGPIAALAGGLGAAVTGQPTDAGSIAAQNSNLTARALIAKGADPAVVAAAAKNPALMTELIKQHFGPARAPTVLGNGYIWQDGKITRAYEPEAKAPTSLGEGYVWNPEKGQIERAYVPDAKKGPEKDIADREQAIISRGLDPKDPRNQQYILTGKYPREDAQPLTATDKKAILEADDAVMATTNVIGNLNKIKELSKKAYEGPLAGARGYISSLVGSEAGTATSEMDNLIMTNALQQLKQIFGGNPTEGERAILLKIQGASSQPDSVRQKIFDQAIHLAQRRLEFEKQRADALRGGTFYKPGQGSAEPQLQPGQSTGMGNVVIKRID